VAELKLEIVEGPEAGRCIALAGGVLEIGRDSAASLRLADPLVSRRHARISNEDGRAVIEDLGSSNGTLVNDRPVRGRLELSVGDKLVIGDSTLVVRGDPAPTARSAASLVGSEFAGYRVEAIVARGGMGVVYRAEHLRLQRKVALKLLSPELAMDAEFRRRFETESRLAAAIDHPNIIPLYDAGIEDGSLFLAMRFVDGLDLRAVLEQDGPLELDRAVSIVGQVGAALDAAHRRGLVHRDVKPANVLLASGAGAEASDHCYLTDFGLSRDTRSDSRLTKPGEFVGTVDYAAPEQIRGDACDGAADRYALGCLLYECLTGHPPFEHDNELAVIRAHVRDDPPAVSARRPDLPRSLDAIVARAMAKQPGDRFASCAALVLASRDTEIGRRRRRVR
jgi:serine/threonine protein kinase